MNFKSQHEKNPAWPVAVLFCGFLSVGCLSSYAETSLSHVQIVGQASEKVITGTILDEAGLPIVGANVTVKGTLKGTISDVDGVFKLSVPQNNSVLVISFIGYKTITLPVGTNTVLKIAMEPEAEQLNEVVVTALGIKREKKALGYAMQEVKTDALTENKSVSVANMLQGKIAGVQIAQSGTGMGGSTRIIMRGLNSLSGKNQPLWVVDGFPIDDGAPSEGGQWGGVDCAGAASQINPEDIESISVLKGANAAALYGSRAQNGAIVITTKKGKKGQPLSIEYNGNVNFSKAYSPYEYQNVYAQGTAGVYDMKATGSWGPKMTGQMVSNWRRELYGDDRYKDYALLPQKDYITDFYETGLSYSNTLTAMAGGENLSGRLSFTDTRNNDITPNHSLNRQYFDLHTEFNNNYLTIGAKLNYMREKSRNRPIQGEPGVMKQLIRLPRGIRLEDLKNPRGVGNYMNNSVNWSGPSTDYFNPYALTASENGDKYSRNRIIGQLSVTGKITDYLKLTGRVGIDWYHDQTLFLNMLNDPSDPQSQYKKNRTTNQEFNADLILYFDKTFGDFSVNANVGTSVVNMQNDALAASSGMLAISGTANLGNGLNQTVSEGYSKKEIQSVFFNASVGYKSMAYLDVTGRNDWSSTLPSFNRSYFYPSVSGSVILSEMFKLPDWVTYFKIRGSWAKVGNDTDPYRLASLYTFWSSTDNRINPSSLKLLLGGQLPLTDLKPESTTSTEIGTEIRLLDGRFGIDFTYYKSVTKDQILGISMPASSGYTSKLINAGKIQSHGYEVMLSGTPIKTKDWTWNLNLNWGMNRTKCVSLDKDIKRLTLGILRTGSVVINEGGQYGDIVGNSYKRDEQGRIIVGDNGMPISESGKVIGNMMPKWTGSIGNSVRWKDLTLSALIDVRYGGDFISNTDNYACQAGTSAKTLFGRENGEKIVVDGVTEAGKPNTVGVSAEDYWSTVAGPSGIIEEFLHKGTYVKMRELSLGYSLPNMWLKKTPLKAVKVSLVGRDLFYFYKDAPVNPEGAFSRSDYAQAFELGAMPPTRTFGFSLNVKF